MKKTLFCSQCQQDTHHTAKVDGNGEFLFTCTTEGCDRFIKLPADSTPDAAAVFFAAHKEQNQGQVSVAAQEQKLQTLLDALD